jgi:hypothetical protein
LLLPKPRDARPPRGGRPPPLPASLAKCESRVPVDSESDPSLPAESVAVRMSPR